MRPAFFVLLLALAGVVLSPAFGRAEIVIATAGPLTGHNIFRGEQIQQGAEMAVADINAAGGVLGRRLELLIADDACDPEQAVAVARKLAHEGAIFVAGHVCSHSSIPASRVYEAADIVMISPASTNPRLTDEGGRNVFRTCGRDDRQGIVAGEYLADDWGEGQIAIIHDGSTYGKGLADQTRARLRQRGVSEALYQAFASGGRDYSDLVDRMRQAGIDVVYVGAYSTDVGLIVRQARDRGFTAQFVSGDALTNGEFWMITGLAGEGTRGTFGPDPLRNRQAADVVARFRRRGFEPSGYTLHTYAAVAIWAAAVERAGTLEADAVVASLHQGRFDSVLGRVGFDEKGDITASAFVWYAWRDGEYLELDR